MVYILPKGRPHVSPELSYTHAYENILRARRQSPHTSASIIMLVPPQLDAICAARMLAALFYQDEVLYRIIPVSGYPSLQLVKQDLSTLQQVRLSPNYNYPISTKHPDLSSSFTRLFSLI